VATLGPTTARDVIDALSALQRVQNEFLSVWVNYEVQRLQLDLDLGTMRLDERGIWIDPGDVSAAAKAGLYCGLPGGMPPGELDFEGIEPGRIEELSPDLRIDGPADGGDDAEVFDDAAADEEGAGFPGDLFQPSQPPLLPGGEADEELEPVPPPAPEDENPALEEGEEEAANRGTRLTLLVAPEPLDRGALKAAHEERSHPPRVSDSPRGVWRSALSPPPPDSDGGR
jgi:hypothetical protein